MPTGVALDLPFLLVAGAVIVIALTLAYRLISRDPSVHKARWGVFVERERYPEQDGETWTVDPLPPRSDELPTKEWPKREHGE